MSGTAHSAATGTRRSHALVTGASRGIGRAIAVALAQRGHIVSGTATTPDGAAALGAALGAPHEGLVLDAADPASIDRLFADLEARERLPTILVNNAAITRDGLLMRMKDADWDQVIATNLSGVFRISRAALRRMIREREGRIISITSVVGAMGNPGQTNYAAAKAGIEGFTRALALEVASRNVTVNAVAPGFIDTDMTRVLSEAQRSAILSGIPMARLGRPEDIAAAVAYLVSPEASYVTGQTLHVNGGLYRG